MIATILIWIAGILGTLLALGVIIAVYFFYLFTRLEEDERYEIDSFDPHVVDSARQAKPKSARIADMPEQMGY